MNTQWPQPDWSDIQPSDDLITWLRRTCPDFTWNGDGSGENVIGFLTSEYEPAAPHFTPRLTQTEWDLAYGRRKQGSPVWPGISFVTLSTPVALAAGVTINEAMDGVLVQITATDPKALYYTYDDILAYRHLGALTFLTDNGDAEPFQALGFASAIYVPRTMARAATLKLMVPGGTVGTVTPWLRV